MTHRLTEKQHKLGFFLADYILNDDREEEDYKRHCEENGLNPDDFEFNSQQEAAHIYAIAQEFFSEVYSK
jgi:hypothetical protein